MWLKTPAPRTLFLIGLVVYGLTAWCSEGYHHPDEHFQVLEFANYKIGRTPAADLPWEFAAQIRPGLQPMLTVAAIRSAEALGIQSPFSQIFLLRLLTGWMCLWLYFQWANWVSIVSGEERAGQWLRLAVVFGWFVPYLSVRFSSENVAGLAFAWGLLLLCKAGKLLTFQRGLLIGFLLGLSFSFRFQMGFALLGMGGWLVFRGTEHSMVRRLSHMIPLLFGGIFALALGFYADRWLYGESVFTAYNYFTANILENKAANWGTAPWWFYFVQTVLTVVPPISIFLLGFVALGIWRARNREVTWALLPFLLAHLLVAHKEMRFLYPMLLPVLVLGALGLAAFFQERRSGARRFWSVLFYIAVGINFVLLPLRCLLAAQESVPYFHKLYHCTRKVARRVFCVEKSAYNLVGLETHFYCSPKIQTVVVEHFNMIKPSAGDLLLSRSLTIDDLPPGVLAERVYTYFPDWMLYFNPNNWQSRARIWSIYEVK